MENEREEQHEWREDECFHPLYMAYRSAYTWLPWKGPEPLSFAEYWERQRDLPDVW